MPMINLGDKVRDEVTGFEGIVVAKTVWLHGCIRCTVQPRGLDKEGKTLATDSFDELQLALVEAGVVLASSSPLLARPREVSKGGPRPEADRGRGEVRR